MNDTLTLSPQSSLYIYNQGKDLFLVSLPFTRVPHIRHLHRGFQGDFHCCVYKESPIFLFRNTKNQIVLLHSLSNSSSFMELVLLEDKEENEEFNDFHLTVVQNRLFFFYTIYTHSDKSCQLYYNMPFEQTGIAAICDFNSKSKEKLDKNKEISILNQKIDYITQQYNELYDYSIKLQVEAKRLKSLLEKKD